MELRILQRNDEGFVLITSMMIMVILTIIGIMAVSTTEIELMVAGNDKVAKAAFYRADSGIFTAPKVIREAIDAGPGIEVRSMALDYDPAPDSDQEEFFRKIMGFNDATTNIAFSQGEGEIDTDIYRSGAAKLPGESVEFASGYDGGPTTSQGVGIFYTLNATGTAPANAESTIQALYRFIPGRPGGL